MHVISQLKVELRRTFSRPLNQMRLILVLIFCLLVLASPIGLWAQKGPDHITEFEPPKGFIDKFGQESEFLAFSSNGNQLKPIFSENAEANESKLNAIKVAVRSNSGGSSRWGGSWCYNFRGPNFEAGCGIGSNLRFGFGGKEQFWIYAKDSSQSESVLRVEVKKSGAIKIDLSANHGLSLFRFRQLGSGDIDCQDFNGAFTFAGSAKTFDAFCRKHPDYVRKRLGPIFKYLGLGAPPNRYSETVAKSVVASLEPVRGSRMKDFQEAITGLDADSFSDREAATKSLEKNFEDWKDLIHSAITNEEMAVEIRTRLRKIYKKTVTAQEAGDLELALKSKLEDDVSYLIWLLECCKTDTLDVDEKVESLIVSRIETQTGEKHGDDLAKWQSWLERERKLISEEPEPTISDAEILLIKGTLEKNAEQIGKLVRLELIEGRLKLDQKHWASSFDGKSIKELASQAKKRIKELNLPESWFKAGGDFSLAGTDYPQILFEQMKIFNSGVEKESYLRRKIAVTFNREITSSKLKASLNVHNVSSDGRAKAGGILKKVQPDFFQLAMEETNGEFKRRFTFVETKAGEILLSLEYPSKDAMIRVVQASDSAELSENGFMVFDIRGPATKRYAATTFDEFRKNEKQYFDSVLAPLLKKLGIEIGETTPEVTPEVTPQPNSGK